VIGGGDGGAAEEALKHPSIEQLVMVELDGKVVEIAKEHFGTIHRGVFDNPKAQAADRGRAEVRRGNQGKVRLHRARFARSDRPRNRSLRRDVLPRLQARPCAAVCSPCTWARPGRAPTE